MDTEVGVNCFQLSVFRFHLFQDRDRREQDYAESLREYEVALHQCQTVCSDIHDEVSIAYTAKSGLGDFVLIDFETYSTQLQNIQNCQEAKQACETWRSQLGDALIKRYEPVFRRVQGLSVFKVWLGVGREGVWLIPKPRIPESSNQEDLAK